MFIPAKAMSSQPNRRIKKSIMDNFLKLPRMQNYRGSTNDPVCKVYHSNTDNIDIQFIFINKRTFKFARKKNKINA